MRMLICVLTITAVFPILGCKNMSPSNQSDKATGQPAPSPTQATAAQEGLVTFQKLVDAKNYAQLGFSSPEAAARATLGEPMQIFLIRLDKLQNFTGDTNPDTLLTDARRTLYPVELDKRVATSLTVTQRDDGWRATDFGNRSIARAVTRYRSDPGDFIVHAAALKLYFVGRRTEGRLMLIPVMHDERLGFRAGESIPAERVLATLQQAAQGYNGLPQ
jgi:hypothetical protein